MAYSCVVADSCGSWNLWLLEAMVADIYGTVADIYGNVADIFGSRKLGSWHLWPKADHYGSW